MEQNIVGADAMQQYAADFVRALKRGPTATVVLLYGDLGAGKTTFVQGAAKALGIDEPITSPTFVIQKSYPLSGQQFERLIHIDAYRLKDAHELEVLDWSGTIANPGNVVFLEWPERVSGVLPEAAIKLHLRFIDEQTREVRHDTVSA